MSVRELLARIADGIQDARRAKPSIGDWLAAEIARSVAAPPRDGGEGREDLAGRMWTTPNTPTGQSPDSRTPGQRWSGARRPTPSVAAPPREDEGKPEGGDLAAMAVDARHLRLTAEKLRATGDRALSGPASLVEQVAERLAAHRCAPAPLGSGPATGAKR